MRARERVYRVVIRLFLGVFRLLGLKITVTGAEHLPTAGGGVVASNHISFLDYTFIQYAALPTGRYVRFMAKKSIWGVPVAGWLMRKMKHIPVDRSAGLASYRHAVDALAGGELVGVFPEATISQSFQLKDFKSGVVRMAADAGVPIVPVVTWGGQRIWTKSRARSLKRGKAITVMVGEPIPSGTRRELRATMQTLRERMTAMLEEAQRTYPQQPSGPDDRWWVPAALGGTAPTPEQAAARDGGDATR